MPINNNLDEKYLTLSGVMATLAIGILQNLFSDLTNGVFLTELSNIIITASLITILLHFFPEPRVRFSIRTLLMAAGGVILAFLYWYFLYKREGHLSPDRSIGLNVYILYLIDIGIATPFFEELVVRRLLFDGVAKWLQRTNHSLHSLSYLISATLISAAFGYLHKGMAWMAFTFSMGMCAASFKGIKTFDRSIFHGFYNISVVIIPSIFKLNF